MPYTDTSKSQAANRTSCHASHRYLQITGNKSCFLPCFTQIPANPRQQNVLLTTQVPANHSQQIINLAMTHTDIKKPKGQIIHLTMPHTGASNTQATNRTSYHASHRYQQVTGNKSFILPCLTQIPANHRQQIVHLAMPHTDTSNQRQQIVHLTMPHTDTSKFTGNKSYILPCLTQIPANHRQQIVHPSMPHADTRKSQATNRTSCHASHRYQQITGNKCLTQIPANHRQQIVNLAIPHTDTSKSQATKSKSFHA